MRAARDHTALRSKKRLNFYVTSELFPSISITGSHCSLNCKHCGTRLLERIIPCSGPDELIRLAGRLEAGGAKGLLITGGCDPAGKVPIPDAADAIRAIKDTTDLIVIAHTGFITRDEALRLMDSGLDGVGLDVVGDEETARRVYGLDVTGRDYTSSMEALNGAGIMLFPHVCVGLDGGVMHGELRALEMIRGYDVSTVVITGLMPVAGTEFAGLRPDPLDFAAVITYAVELFPDVPITLGCARSAGQDRMLIDQLAIESGIGNIAVPTRYAVDYAVRNGFSVQFYGTCCGLPPSEGTRIRNPYGAADQIQGRAADVYSENTGNVNPYGGST